ncbi:patatin-like phospholipase family protein [Hydrogenophilus thiooxidans]|uniref:patatin-like phospholipase family protein n=1 Tax=Hydrogenophilus thiooxidans TaxID=2820326 RepID=UPI001C2467F5|nr:patatin-like phospholipase family protein [Hydrogenophilus thiooxidans]
MKVGLALGSGSARGWAHFGVIRELRALGVSIDIVCGTSVGALVGAALASGNEEAMAEWVARLGWTDVVALMDVSLRGGALQGDKVVEYCAEHFFADRFEALQLPFACVATELSSGREVWLREGLLAPALRASIALPGMFQPQRLGGHWLVDGGLVNPVPVSLCRALGADVVIAVELGAGRATRHMRKAAEEIPTLGAVLATSINIMQTRIARARLAGDPPDVLIQPRLTEFSILDFHRGKEAIEEGVAATRRVRAQIEAVLDGF